MTEYNSLSYTQLRSYITTQLLASDSYRNLAESYTWMLMEAATSQSRSYLIQHGSDSASKVEYEWIKNALERLLIHHEPIQYIIGSVPFLDLIIEVKSPILIPRHETEEWVATLITHYKKSTHSPKTILDLCTGSGCIALALAQAFPAATIIGTDINPHAIDLAQKNAQKNSIKNIEFFVSDLYSAIPSDYTFDLIVANPPYIPESAWDNLEPSVRLWEDRNALITTDNGVTLIEKIINNSSLFLNKNSSELWIEIDIHQAEQVTALFAQTGFSDIQVHVDSAGHTRVIHGTYRKL